MPKSRERSYLRAPLFVLFVALLSTAGASWIFSRTIETKDRERFTNQVEQITDEVRHHLRTYMAMLSSGAGLFAVDHLIDRNEFQAFAGRMQIQQEYPGVQGIGWSKRVAVAERGAVEASMRAQGVPDFRIWPDTPRSEYHSILFLEPRDRRNEAAIGYDMFTQPTRRAAMERARDTGMAAATGKVTLVQEIDERKQAGFLIYVPVYRGGSVPATVHERRAALLGFVYSPFRADDLLERIFGTEPHPRLRFDVYDGSAEPENLLHRSAGGGPPERPSRLETSRTIDVAGRTWTLVYRSGPWFERSSSRTLLPVLICGGVFVSLVLFGLTLAQARARKSADDTAADLRRSREELSEERERLHVTLASIGDAVLVTDEHGIVTFLNPVAESLTGWALEEAAGKSLEEIFRVVDDETVGPSEDPGRGSSRRDSVGAPARKVLIARDGVERVIEETAAPIRRGEGVQGIVVVFHDITERKRTEQRQAILAEAGRILGSSLDYEATLTSVCNLVVPAFADWCALDLLDSEGTVRRLAVAHRDPDKVQLAHELWRRYPPLESDQHGLMAVLRSGEPEFYPIITDGLLQKSARDPEHLEVLRALGLTSAIVAPMNARGRTIGAMTLVAAESSPPFVDDDRSVATELATRAALAVDNARLFSESREAAARREEALQLHRNVEEQLTLLVEASGSLSASLDLSSVLEAVLDLSKRLIAADAYAIWQHDRTSGQWKIGLAANLSEEYQQDTIRVLAETPGMPEHPIIAEDVLGVSILNERVKSYEREGIRSLLVLPLRIRGGASGTLAFYFRTPHRFSEVEIRVATALSNLAATAIGTAELYGELKSNNRRKDEFLAMLAHELRNPLAAVNNAVTVLGMVESPADIDFATHIIKRQTKQLTRLIDDLLDVSRITTGKVRLRKERVDAGCVVEHALESARPLIEERMHNITIAVEPGGLPLDADPTRLEQIVVNLLSNAAKYTENGGTIALTARRAGTDIVISVKDNGIGIPPDRLPEMFELFAQGERSIARSEGGLGIGLTVVQKLTEMHGGRIDARSDGPGKGSEFSVRFPAAAGLQQGAQPPPLQANGTGRVRILVVDDNVDTADSLARVLRQLGNDVHVAYDGPSAVQAAADFRPGVILLDIGLPGMDGYEVAKKLRSHAVCERSMIVAVTGYGQEEDRQRAAAAGIDHHLVKPVEFERLLPLLSRKT